MPELSCLGLAVTLQDAFALADARGPDAVIVFGLQPGLADIYAPSGLILNESEAATALAHQAGHYFVSAGNSAVPLDIRTLAPLLTLAIERSGIGFMAACFAAPEQGRTVYHGNLFQDGTLTGNLRRAFSEEMPERVALIAHPTVAQGPTAIRRAIASAREQGYGLALIDSIDFKQCAAIATALEGQLLTAGPAWLAQGPEKPSPAPSSAPVAILSGTLDRQTLYQLGAARAAMPFLQLDLSSHDAVANAIAWGDAQQENYIIASSVPPDRVIPGAPAATILAEIAAGLAANGVRRFLFTGNDTASAILTRLGIKTLTTGASQAGLRWFSTGDTNFAFKPSGFGERNLFLGEFGPQIRLNATAECTL